MQRLKKSFGRIWNFLAMIVSRRHLSVIIVYLCSNFNVIVCNNVLTFKVALMIKDVSDVLGPSGSLHTLH